MSYVGQKIEIPLGKSGVRTDDANTDLQPGELFRALNVDFYQGILQKAPGSRIWNKDPVTQLSLPLPSSVVAVYDWYPVEGVKKVIAACSDGQLYLFKNPYQYSVIPPATNADPAKLTMTEQPHFIAGGSQTATMNRKLFFFSGSDIPQVIDGDTGVRRNIAKPAVEWKDGNFPKFGLIYRNKLFAIGHSGDPHLVLASTTVDAEDFQTFGGDPTTAYRIFPGDGEGVTSGFVYHSKLFIMKYPQGVYTLNDTDTTPTNWYFEKLNTSLGAASSHSPAEVIDDVAVANQFGTVSMMSAAFQLGQTKFADLMSNLRVESMVRAETRPMVRSARWSLYYPDKKLALFTYQSSSGTIADRFVCVDFTSNKPKAHLLDKDKPMCLFLMKDDTEVQVPAYGASDGNIYIMDDVNRLVGTGGYAFEFRIPYVDFNQQTHKIFDALEVECEHTGLWDLLCDVHIDDYFSETIRFQMANSNVLRKDRDDKCFKLDQDRLIGRQTKSVRRALHGRGRRVAFRFYSNDLTGQNFKLTKLIVYARLGNEDKTSK